MAKREAAERLLHLKISLLAEQRVDTLAFGAIERSVRYALRIG
jgi:hypothetical protein